MADVQLLFTLIMSILCFFGESFGQNTTPEQIHLSYGVDPSHMVVTWSTMNETKTVCNYGHDGYKLEMQAQGQSTKFTQQTHTQYIHRVTLTGLKSGIKYFYTCGDGKQMSNQSSFQAKRTDPSWSPSMAMFGDMGNTNAQSLKRLLNDTIDGKYDAIFHVGDFAYDMDSNNGLTGDAFMNNIQPIATKVPYMTCPGNHESNYNFSNYKNRFTMPTDEHGDRMFYSFDMGPMHIISFSTEYYFFLQYGIVEAPRQFKWLEQDLKIANTNRKKTPWIMTMAHRPMYCSNKNRDDCTHYHSIVREGIPFIHILALEKLFYKYGVDLMVWAHEHSYERLWPVFNQMVMNGTTAPYTDPGAPVHIITGSAGCDEDHDPFLKDPKKWTAFRSEDYGYTRMKVFNASHLYLEQVSDDKDGEIIDSMWYIKHRN